MRKASEVETEYVASLFKTFYEDWISDYDFKTELPSLKDAEEFLEGFTKRGMDVKAFKNVFGREPTDEERQKIKEKFLKMVQPIVVKAVKERLYRSG